MRLACLREKVPPDEAASIEAALGVFYEQGQRWAEADLRNLLRRQLSRLRRLRCPEDLLEDLMGLEEMLLGLAARQRLVGLPALPVVPRACLPLERLVGMVRHNGHPCRTYLDQEMIIDDLDLPRRPYYLVGVEDGHATRGLTPHESGEILEGIGRRILTCDEILAVATHIKVLHRHFLDAGGSQYGHPSRNLTLYLPSGIRTPKLNWDFRTNRYHRRGSPSCTGVVS